MHNRPDTLLPKICVAAVVGLLVSGVVAQEPQIRQLDQPSLPPVASSATNTANDISTEEYEGGELGRQVILMRRPRPQIFRVSSDTEYLFNSNVLLLEHNRIEDSLFSETVNASVSPRLLDSLASTAYVQHQLIRYAAHSAQDFDADSAGLNLSHPVHDWFTLYGGFSATRAYFRANDNEFFKMFDARFGLWRGQPLTTRAWLVYGYQLDWRPSSPSSFTRVDNAGYIGLHLTPTSRLAIDILYRLRAEEYLQVNRSDLNHLISASVSYTFNNYITARASADFGHNDSNTAGFDYNVFEGGGGLMLQVKF